MKVYDDRRTIADSAVCVLELQAYEYENEFKELAALLELEDQLSKVSVAWSGGWKILKNRLKNSYVVTQKKLTHF